MLLILIFLRFALSVVFGVAGIAKLLDSRGARDAVTNFGVPAQFSKTVALLLPVAELAIAVGLLLPRFERLTALSGLLLLVVFSVVIGLNLLRGRSPECHCFGQLYSKPLGWPTLVRNALFAICAGFVFLELPRAGNTKTSTGLTPLDLLAYLVIVLTAATLLILLMNRRKRRSAYDHQKTDPQGLPVGSAAPLFDLASYEGGRGSLKQLLAQARPLLLIFTNPHCGPCVSIFQEVGKWQRDYSNQITIVLITQGSIKENFVNVSRNSLANVLLQEQEEVGKAYKATMTPTAVIVNQEGEIASTVVAGATEIRRLLNDWLHSTPAIEMAAQLGEPALST
jgi:thiol-disulfide isomerase/thioredoxin